MVNVPWRSFAKAKLNKGEVLRRQKLADKLTIHGLPLALKSKSWYGRLFWTLLFLTALGVLLFQLVRLVSNIARSPTVINLQQKQEDLMVLPEVTLCAPQTFNVSKLYADGLSLEVTNFMTSDVNAGPNSTWKTATEFSLEVLEYNKAIVFSHASSWVEFLDKYSVKCEDFFLTCKVDWQKFNCCEVFQVIYTPDMGICYQNKEMADEMKQIHAGINGSLEVLLRTPKSNPMWNGGPMWSGITIGLPYLYDPYITEPGQFLMARIATTYYIRDTLDLPCDPAPRRMTRQSGCPHSTWNDAVETICGCVLYLRKSEMEKNTVEGKNITLCDPFNKILCFHNKYDEVMKEYERRYNKHCTRNLCSEWHFEIALSYAQINRAWVRSRMEDIAKDMDYSLLNFYFPSLSYQEIMEFNSLGFENIISSVGGLMGLWLGCSMLSVIELLIFGVSLLSSKVYNWFSVESGYRIK